MIRTCEHDEPMCRELNSLNLIIGMGQTRPELNNAIQSLSLSVVQGQLTCGQSSHRHRSHIKSVI